MALTDVTYYKLLIDEDTLRGLTAVESDPWRIIDAKIQDAIDRAYAYLYSRLKQRYSMPPVGAAEELTYLKNLEFMLGRYYLFALKYEDEELKEVHSNYKSALKEIDEIGAGTIKLNLQKSQSTIDIPMATNKTSSDRRIEWL